MGTVSQHQITTFTSPSNGQTPIDATVVRGNDNTIRTNYNAHDADTTVHLQNGILSSRPVAGTAGQQWLTSDTGAVYLYLDTGSAWVEANYLRNTGGTVSGALQINGTVGTTGNVLVRNATNTSVFIDTSTGGAGDVALLAWGRNGTVKWEAGLNVTTGSDAFDIYSGTAAGTALSIDATTRLVTVLTGLTATTGNLRATAGFLIAGSMATTGATAPTVCLSNTTAPTISPVGGGYLYVVAGQLRYMGSAGTITVLGNA